MNWKFSTPLGNQTAVDAAHLYVKTLNYNILNNIVGESGLLMLTNIELSNILYSVVNVYAPNDSCNRNIFFSICTKFNQES